MTWPFPMQSAHPMFVHAPIGLLATAGILDLLAAALRHPGMRRVALWNLALGALAAIAAVVTGLRAEAVAKHSFEINEVMELHERLGWVIANLAGALTAWRLVRRDAMAGAERAVVVVLEVALLAVLGYSAHLGGRLVYEFGVGGSFGHG